MTEQQHLPLESSTNFKPVIESLLFASDDPLSVKQIKAILDEPDATGKPPMLVDATTIKQHIVELNQEYEQQNRSYRIIQIAGGYQFATQPQFAEWLGRLFKEKAKRKLSQSSIETLSIIAYKQPITKPEIERIRGVNSDYVMKRLLERRLITIVGRATTVGRPLLYGTTREFLKHFGINDLSDLPKPREIEEILSEENFGEVEKHLIAEERQSEEQPTPPEVSRSISEEKTNITLEDLFKSNDRSVGTKSDDEGEPVG